MNTKNDLGLGVQLEIVYLGDESNIIIVYYMRHSVNECLFFITYTAKLTIEFDFLFHYNPID